MSSVCVQIHFKKYIRSCLGGGRQLEQKRRQQQVRSYSCGKIHLLFEYTNKCHVLSTFYKANVKVIAAAYYLHLFSKK